jgi:hypothetical protein
MKILIIIFFTSAILFIFRKAGKAKEQQKKIDRAVKMKYYYPKN